MNVRNIAVMSGFALCLAGLHGWSQSGNPASKPLPSWAFVEPAMGNFGGGGPGGPGGGRTSTPIQMPGSKVRYVESDFANLFDAPDWYPDAHPPMPEAVVHGRKPDTFACAFCHLPNGLARPENESVSGLPAAYMIQQIQDFKTGLRKSSDPKLMSVVHMIQVAKGLTDDDIKQSVEYYAAQKPQAAFRVVESDTVPKTHTVMFMLQKTDDGLTEPIGNRVIELPEDSFRTAHHDANSGFVVYAPVGSVKKGEALVKTGGNGETMACGVCHGSDLRGVAAVPSIAGRSPSSMARQLIDFQTGARNGPNAVLMKPVVAKLTDEDVVNIVAYLSSLKP